MSYIFKGICPLPIIYLPLLCSCNSLFCISISSSAFLSVILLHFPLWKFIIEIFVPSFLYSYNLSEPYDFFRLNTKWYGNIYVASLFGSQLLTKALNFLLPMLLGFNTGYFLNVGSPSLHYFLLCLVFLTLLLLSTFIFALIFKFSSLSFTTY